MFSFYGMVTVMGFSSLVKAIKFPLITLVSAEVIVRMHNEMKILGYESAGDYLSMILSDDSGGAGLFALNEHAEGVLYQLQVYLNQVEYVLDQVELDELIRLKVKNNLLLASETIRLLPQISAISPHPLR